MNTRISSKSDFVRLLFACIISVAVLKTRSMEPEDAGTEKISLAIPARTGNLKALIFQYCKTRTLTSFDFGSTRSAFSYIGLNGSQMYRSNSSSTLDVRLDGAFWLNELNSDDALTSLLASSKEHSEVLWSLRTAMVCCSSKKWRGVNIERYYTNYNKTTNFGIAFPTLS